jgi:hypothetical protein
MGSGDNQGFDMKEEKESGFQKSNQGFVAMWLTVEAGLLGGFVCARCSLCPGVKE